MKLWGRFLCFIGIHRWISAEGEDDEYTFPVPHWESPSICNRCGEWKD